MAVYITHDSGLDYGKASRFGELHVVCGNPINVFNTDALWDAVTKGLEGFRNGDHLLVSGSALVALFALQSLPDDVANVKLLLWDAKQRDYYVRTIEL